MIAALALAAALGSPSPTSSPATTVDVVVGAGHEGRPASCARFPHHHCNLGAAGERAWTPVVADAATGILRAHGITVARLPADFAGRYDAGAAVFIHFDGNAKPCSTGASIGYHFAQDVAAAANWRKLYGRYIPFRFMPDNFTNNLHDYYGLRQVHATNGALVLELGEIDCQSQKAWLAPRLRWEGALLAYFLATQIGRHDVPDPGPFKPAVTGQFRWRSIGPAVSGGRLAAVAGTDQDPYLYYVGAAGGGVWKSTNAGQSWTPVFDDQGIASIGAVAIDPTDVQSVWVGTGEANPRNDVIPGNGVYRTTDGAKTWKRVLPLDGALVGTISIDPTNGQNVVVAVLGDPFADNVDRGIYRTTDGGATWTKTLYLDPRSGASDVLRMPGSPATLFAGMWDFRRTGWSLNSGGSDDGIFKSIDGGATWSKLEGDGLPPAPVGRIALAASPANPSRIYAIVQSSRGLLWRSDDAGATWAMRSNDALIDERPFYFSHLSVDPTNADHLWSSSVHLTVSIDGGKTFVATARGTHGDHHAMWIAADGKRIIEGNDGGVAFSMDAGTSWEWRNILPVSQAYRVGVSRGIGYSVCAPLQDNGIWCGPSNPLASRVSASQWRDVGGGDGTYALFDPRDNDRVWQTSGGGNFSGDADIFDFSTGEFWSIAPYMRDQNALDPKNLRYRLNWETPIAFDPFDARVAYVGADVLFRTQDAGVRWTPISPDLTRNERSHELVTGGITLDGTGAETSETILAIEPSHRARGMIWIGTDDGLVRLTRDGGKHWSDVTPPTARSQPWGRFASISASVADAASAYAIYDRHMVGDRAPYVFATHDYGRSWTSIGSNLPTDAPARSVLDDPRNPSLVYVGTDLGIFASWNGGATFEPLGGGLPPAAVRGIVIQPDTDDLVIATHGRGIWVLDDASPAQRLTAARRADAFLFPVRTAYAWQLHDYFGTGKDGAAPQYGAIVSYYQARPLAFAPTAQILDARGRVVRSFTTHEERGKCVADLTNDVGINRFVWDLAAAAPTRWNAAPAWNNYYEDGAAVVPGRYVVRIRSDGRTLETSIVVAADPRMHYTQAQYVARYDAATRLLGDYDRLDQQLNVLSRIVSEGRARIASLDAKNDQALSASVGTVVAGARALIATMSSNPVNDQDNDFLVDRLRERLQTQIDTFGSSFAPPTLEQQREGSALHALSVSTTSAFAAFEVGDVRTIDEALRSAGLPALTVRTVPVPTTRGEDRVGGDRR